LIRDGIDGLLFTTSNVQELTAAIGNLIDSPDVRRKMAESSRERISDKYDLQKNVGRLSEVFSRWIAAKSGPSASR
jgi:glycosyltransferase involved in cell wall biosynthesis